MATADRAWPAAPQNAAFDRADADHDGCLQRAEFHRAVRNLHGLRPHDTRIQRGGPARRARALEQQPEGAPRFRHVLLVGSQQDKYVPPYSSLLHMPAALAASSDRRAPLLRRLVEGSLDSMAASNLIRVDVPFRDQPKYFKLDQVAGRAVHTMFLENTEFLRLFAARYAHCFES